MNKIILALGYIPNSKGGKHKTGLATGVFDLHDAVNQLKSEFKIVIAATDIHTQRTIIENTEVIGWNKKILLKHLLKHPLRTFFFIFKSIELLRFYKIIKPLSFLAKMIFLDYAIDLINPDFVHLHGNIGALISSGIRNKEIKKILRLHGINGFDPNIANYKLHRVIEKKITNFHFEKVSFVTNGICEEWRKEYGDFTCEMCPILNGYNHNIFNVSLNLSLTEKKFDLITYSGISERKGQGRVLKALRNLQNNSNMYLSYLIIGSGNKQYEKLLKEYSNNNNLNVTFKDYLPQSEIVKYLHKSKYFILPSSTEGFGKVYIESIGSGVPVIIPKDLPLAKEQGLLNKVNSYKLDDYTSDSIEYGLKMLFKNKYSYSETEVSDSVKFLQWSEIAREYITMIYCNIV